MTYDGARHQMLLLATDGMWAFDGGTLRWAKLPPAANPPQLSGGTIAFDSAHGNVVYFGGTNTICDPGVQDQTWIWDGATWTQVHPANAPNECFGCFGRQATYDPARRRVVVIGTGQQTDGTVWEWDGTNWTNPSGGGFAGTAATYDARSGRVITFGGTFYWHGWNDVGNTMAWDGTTWTSLSNGGGARDPQPRSYAAMMYDPVVGAPVLFGGGSARPDSISLEMTWHSDTWWWQRTHWVQMGTRTAPPPGSGALAYDTDHRLGVYFSGKSQTWLFTAATAGNGYFAGERDGSVVGLGDARNVGDAHAIRLNQPIVGIARTVTRNGYWLAAGDGGIFSYGDAHFYGSTGNIRLNQPIVGIAPTPSGRGYWLVARDGGVFAFGDALFAGSTGNMRLNQPIVGMASTPTGDGYWLVASDGGIFAFGDAHFYGSTGNIRLNQPVTGMAAAPRGNGYWLVARDGGIFNYGHAPFAGSISSPRAIIAITASPTGSGYTIFDNRGTVHTFGDAHNHGNVPAAQLRAPVVGAVNT